MKISIRGAREHNLKGLDVDFGDGLTVVTGISGSGKTSLVFDTLYHEARRRFLEIYSTGSSTNRLSPALVDQITGLGPAMAVGQNLLNRNPASNLASASGLHPFLRLLYAHFGSWACPVCANPITTFTEDEILDRLIELSREDRTEISVPLVLEIPGSHHQLLQQLASSFDVQDIYVDGQTWEGRKLDPEKSHTIELHIGTLSGGEAVPEIRRMIQEFHFSGSFALIARVKERFIFARAPVCTHCGAWSGETAPSLFHRSCPTCHGEGCQACQGSGLHPLAAAVNWRGFPFVGLLAQTVDDLIPLFEKKEAADITYRLKDEILRRLAVLQRVGLGYIALNRPSPSLSRGESQRVRLALTLISRLEDMLHVLDEPTIGQHAWDVQHLLPAFRELAGPVVFVEHDRIAAAGADRAVDVGPGAGNKGGEIVFCGTPRELWDADTATGRFFSLKERVALPKARPPAAQFVTIREANLRNLRSIDVPIPVGRLTVVTGVSGSGKSTLVEDVLARTLEEGKPCGCAGVDGPHLRAVMVDQSPIGRNPRSNPATYTKLADILRDLFSAATGLSASHFSFNRPEGACPTCKGLGSVEVSMRYLPSTWIPCADCDGQRFTDEVLEAKIDLCGRRLSMAKLLDLSIEEAYLCLKDESRIPNGERQVALRILDALRDIGLGYMSLGQPSTTLSGGEAQRIKLAKYLSQKALSRELLILDEPSTGLHPKDLSGLLAVLDRLVRAGATIVVVEHNLDMVQAADWIIDLGPGAGAQGGELVYAGPAAGLIEIQTSKTAQALQTDQHVQPRGAPEAVAEKRSPSILIRNARMHNLKGIDVEFMKGALTVVTGVSGSGKSTLVKDILEAEAQRRYLETLSMYERQSVQEGPEAEVDQVTGLGVALTAAPGKLAYSRRRTVGTATEISHHLAALFAVSHERICLTCGGWMDRLSDFWKCPSCGSQAGLAKTHLFSSTTYAAACLKCNGVGSLQKPQPKKLIVAPERPLLDGAMYSPGFFPKGYLGKPYNGGYYQVMALAKRHGFDPFKTPWNEMTQAAQQAFLFGEEEPLTLTYESRTGRNTTRTGHFGGFYGFIRDWDVGNTYSDNVPCPECKGARLRPEYLAVKLSGQDVDQLSRATLRELQKIILHVTLDPGDERMVGHSLSAICERLDFLIKVGLGYLHLDRPTGTLSAGEIQRIRLASLLGSGLTSLTILLDEPTRGLHPSEVQALVDALTLLRDAGNTVIIVEHDPLVMRSADYLVDVGPGSGVQGGRIVASGRPDQVARGEGLTAAWLRGDHKPVYRNPRRKPDGWMTILGAKENNLKGDKVDIPLGVLCGVCGVSGSGKSTLIMDTLGRALSPRKMTTSVAYEPVDPGIHDAILGAPKRVILVDQVKAAASSPVNGLGLAEPFRAIFAASDEAIAMGLTADDFATKCSACGGSGLISLDMGFLPDSITSCEVCWGTGFLPEAWDIRIEGRSLPDVYRMRLDEVWEMFKSDERVAKAVKAACDVGLGYLLLRQPGLSLSGGEMQRLKIADELCKNSARGTLYILDEPTVGQHLEDVQRLVQVLYRLVDEGGSVIVVEHHPHLLAACDWLIELGPLGGPEGGHVVASGAPEMLAAGRTPTAPFIKEVLAGGL